MPSTEFIMMKCKNCGGSLKLFNDMDNFVCAHCGTEFMVERREGTVMLKLVGAIQKVQIGTDKTAAELAIGRLKEDLETLSARLAVLREIKETKYKYSICSTCCWSFYVCKNWI